MARLNATASEAAEQSFRQTVPEDAAIGAGRCAARAVKLQYSAVGVDLSESVTFHG